MLTTRQHALLAALVKNYIATARPIASGQLVHAMGSVSSATIRHDLRRLEEEGYIYQPHTSAGRIPTDRGYRYYVDNIRERSVSSTRQQRLNKALQTYEDTYGVRQRAAAKLLAHLVQAIAISSSVDSREVYEAGVAELLGHATDVDPETLEEISEVFAAIDRNMFDLYEAQQQEVQIYIGEENPITQAHYTSILVKTTRTATGERGLLMIIGPKRMPYQRNIPTLSAVAQLLSQT